MEWIKVEDRLPEEEQELLMTYNGLVMEGIFSGGKFCYPERDPWEREEEQEGITHWMPMILPPNDYGTT